MNIFEQGVKCNGLPDGIPVGLYEKHKGHKIGDPHQEEDGVLRWSGRYRLSEHGREITSSTSYFMVPAQSVVRLFFDTLKTGVLVRYRVLDHNG